MPDPDLVPAGALNGVSVGLSVSDSADLARLGLDPRHAELAIGELARAILIAGGRVVYGGRIRPSGFTQMVMNEVRRYGQSRHSLTICLAYPEHRKLSLNEIDDLDRGLGTSGRLECLSISGDVVDPGSDRHDEGEEVVEAEVQARSLTGLRQHMAVATSARVVVGGKLADFNGAMPGVLEEVIVSVRAKQPLYLAGGFGGATALAVRTLGIDDLAWAPPDLPSYDQYDDRVIGALEELRRAAGDSAFTPMDNGLVETELAQLAASHRPGDVATLVAIGLSRQFGTPSD